MAIDLEAIRQGMRGASFGSWPPEGQFRHVDRMRDHVASLIAEVELLRKQVVCEASARVEASQQLQEARNALQRLRDLAGNAYTKTENHRHPVNGGEPLTICQDCGHPKKAETDEELKARKCREITKQFADSVKAPNLIVPYSEAIEKRIEELWTAFQALSKRTDSQTAALYDAVERIDVRCADGTGHNAARMDGIEKHVAHLDEELHRVTAKPRELTLRSEFCFGCPRTGTSHQHYTVL